MMSIFRSSQGKSAIKSKIWIILVLTLLGFACGEFRGLAFFDNWQLDTNFRILRANSIVVPKQDVVVVGIDDATIAGITQPISLWHPHLANFFRAMVVAQPSAVGLDVIFPDRSFEGLLPGYDAVLMRGILEVRRAMPLVLGITVDPLGRPHAIYAPFSSVAGDGALGLALLPMDGDGSLRRFDENIGVNGERVPTLAGQMARRLNLEPSPGYIDYAIGKPFEYVPLSVVLEWFRDAKQQELRQAFGGKPVLLGVVLAFEDRHKVPVAIMAAEPNSRIVPGIFIQAQALRTLLSGHTIIPLNGLCVFLLAAMGAVLWLFGYKFQYALLSSIAVFAIFEAASLVLLKLGYFMPAAAGTATAFIAAFGRLLWETILGIKERFLLRRSFSGYVSPQVMSEILSGKLNPGSAGTKRRVCVLFADIRSFTTRSEGMSPESLIALLNRYFQQVASAIHECGGTVDKFIGDGLMAFFGAPNHILPSPTESALNAAFLMMDRVEQLNDDLHSEGLEPIRIGIGLHTGDAVVGHIGSLERHEYTAIGDTVNVASRLEGLTKDTGCDVIISSEVYSTLSNKRGWADLGEMPIKGHSPIHVFGLKRSIMQGGHRNEID